MDEQKLDFLNSVNKNWSEVDEELKKIIKNKIIKIISDVLKLKLVILEKYSINNMLKYPY